MTTTVVHCKKSAYDIYIGRPSKWGNPFSHRSDTKALFVVSSVKEAISKYENWIRLQLELTAQIHELHGKVLGCWCKPGPCHGDVLSKLAQEDYERRSR